MVAGDNISSMVRVEIFGFVFLVDNSCLCVDFVFNDILKRYGAERMCIYCVPG